MKFRPTEKHVAIKVTEKPITSPGGIYLPPHVKDIHHERQDQEEGVIIAIGQGVKGLQIGERVLFKRVGSVNLINEQGEFLVVDAQRVLTVIEEET